jgi:uncharacterized protein (TIGR01777 family)
VVKVTVTGATGTLGRQLVETLLARGDEVTVLSRDATKAEQAFGGRVRALPWPEPKASRPPAEALAGADGVIHLLGEPVAQRWNDDSRREIRNSRILATANLVGAIGALPESERPGVLVSQSASGYYGPLGDEIVTEDHAPGDDFLARVCVDWEAEALEAEALGLRVALTRTGVVLSESGGALEKMLTPFKLGVGGPVAGGDQYMPWIHADDVVGALVFCLDTEEATGPLNLAAPQPATNAELSRTLGKVLHRPAVAPVPAFALKLLYGDMAQIVTTGVRAVPRRLEQLGYVFREPELESALRSATGKR